MVWALQYLLGLMSSIQVGLILGIRSHTMATWIGLKRRSTQDSDVTMTFVYIFEMDVGQNFCVKCAAVTGDDSI